MSHRDELLAGARRCLEKRGYARTTARDLVAESGTNLASIGYHFGSKEALLNEAIGESFQEWAQRAHELYLAAEPQPDLLGRLAASWTAMVTTFTEYRGLAVAFAEALAQAERQPQLRAQLATTYERCRSTVAAMITESLGDLPAEHARTLASFQIALCDGLLVQWLLDPEATPTGAHLTDAMVAATPEYHLVGRVARGVGASGSHGT